MCGIAGIITERRSGLEDALTRMGAAMHHRGPDDGGTAILPLDGASLGLSFRRLAILDLSPAGHQPMHNPASGDWLIFNGEIYNFAELRKEVLARGVTLRGGSDTEVLLHLLGEHGPEALNRLAGMFALAYYDARRRRVLLARDPLGIKPLYIARGEAGELLFASELRTLIATGRISTQIDPAAVAGFMAYGSVQAPLTILKSVHEFPAGSYRWVKDAGAPADGPKRYWNIPEPTFGGSEPGALAGLRDVLTTSIREHLVSDVPVGVFLSAGIDSTIVASLAARATPSLRTFTIGFDEHRDVSEAPLAAETARRIGAKHTEIQVSGADALAACRKWMNAQDQPCVDGLNSYIISEVVRREGIIVALAGLGGDELFAGYHTFSRVPRFARLLRYVGWLPAGARRSLARLGSAGRSVAVAGKLADTLACDGSLLSIYLQTRKVTPDAMLDELGMHASRVGLTPRLLHPDVEAALAAPHADEIWNISRLESLLYMSNTQLRDSDTNGMAHSIEIRVPMLDTRVLNFAYRLPGRIRLGTPPRPKHLLRAAFAEFLPGELMNRPKSGFSLPVGRWMMDSIRDECEAGIAQLRGEGLLNAAAIDSVWNGFVTSGDTTRYSRAFALVVLGHYLRRLKAGATAATSGVEAAAAGSAGSAVMAGPAT